MTHPVNGSTRRGIHLLTSRTATGGRVPVGGYLPAAPGTISPIPTTFRNRRRQGGDSVDLGLEERMPW